MLFRSARVVRGPNGLKISTAGTTVGALTVNGTATPLPDLGTLDIPGVLSLATNVVERFKGGVHVIALQVKLLNGTGATINIGEATMKIRKP